MNKLTQCQTPSAFRCRILHATYSAIRSYGRRRGVTCSNAQLALINLLRFLKQTTLGTKRKHTFFVHILTSHLTPIGKPYCEGCLQHFVCSAQCALSTFGSTISYVTQIDNVPRTGSTHQNEHYMHIRYSDCFGKRESKRKVDRNKVFVSSPKRGWHVSETTTH